MLYSVPGDPLRDPPSRYNIPLLPGRRPRLKPVEMATIQAYGTIDPVPPNTPAARWRWGAASDRGVVPYAPAMSRGLILYAKTLVGPKVRGPLVSLVDPTGGPDPPMRLSIRMLATAIFSWGVPYT